MSSSRKARPSSDRRRELLRALLRDEGLEGGDLDPIPRRAQPTSAPPSFGQERLWFLSRLAPESPVFNVPAAFELCGPLDLGRLQAALDDTVARHEALRTDFELRGGRPVQRIAPAARVALERIEAGAPFTRAAALAQARVRVRRAFDLARGPLLALTLWPLEGEAHLLLVNVHHIVSEVRSIAVLVRDLLAAYAAARPAPPELPVQFGDFAAWQRERMQGGRYEAQLAYWRERLAGDVPSLQLPTDRPRPAVQDFEGGARSRRLPDRLARELRALARAHDTTLFTTFLAAYATLLARYAGTRDVLIGTPMTERNRAELEGVVGFFVTMLVLRCDLGGDPPFRELLRRAREVVLGAQSNQDVPFEHLVERLQPNRDLSQSPLFQTAFLIQTRAESAFEAPELPGALTVRALDALEVHTATSKFDLSLVVWDEGEGLSASFEYAASLFDAETIERMLAHLEHLCAAAVADPDARLSALPLMGRDERRRIVEEWNATRPAEPEEVCVHRLVEEQADRAPEAVAVVHGGTTLSYGELERRANRLALRLRELGVGHEDLVGICTERSPAMVVAILATLKAGGAYVPLDLSYPGERLRFMLRDAGAKVVVTLPELCERVAEGGARILCVDAAGLPVGEGSGGSDPARPETPATPASLAYVIYTSGSSGRPKGVEVEHRALLNLVRWHRRAYAVTPDDRATHLAGLAFDASVWELWPYLCAGASVHLAREEERLSPAALLRWLAEAEITLGFLPTPLAEAVLAEPLPKGLKVRAVLTGGDRLHRAPERELPFELVNHYGPTENAVVATAIAVPPDPRPDAPAPSIGRPIDGVEVYLLDPAGRPVPVGVPGELHVGGASQARGYHARPALTAEKFVPNPLAEGRSRRIYATGDLARWRPDGTLEFLGRIDAQVKLRGVRIELGEVETVLARHPAVAECAALVRAPQAGAAGAAGEARLVAYVVAAPGQRADAEVLRAWLRELLPPAMVPAAFVPLDALPLTPNGKVDRRALPEPEPDAGSGSTALVRPQGELEEAVAAAWKEALGLDEVDARANFFDVGGHSLLLVAVHARLQAELDPQLSIVELFDYPTVRSLAGRLAERAASGAPTAEPVDGGLARERDRAEGRRARMRSRRRVREGPER